eukprot:1943895-Prorocentrum_lima.AAC.1
MKTPATFHSQQAAGLVSDYPKTHQTFPRLWTSKYCMTRSSPVRPGPSNPSVRALSLNCLGCSGC